MMNVRFQEVKKRKSCLKFNLYCSNLIWPRIKRAPMIPYNLTSKNCGKVLEDWNDKCPAPGDRNTKNFERKDRIIIPLDDVKVH